MDTEYILQTLEQELKTFEHHRIIPLACDRWISSSALQKATRRGQVYLALRAGFTLWQQDRASFWRRTHTIAVEDIGVASPDVVVKVLTAYAHPSWRVKRNDLLVGLYLIKLMCEADKTRVADELLAITGNSIHLKRRREEFFFSENDVLAGVVLDTKQLLPERALALWLLAGTDIFPHDNLPVRKGDPKLAAELLTHLCDHKLLAKGSIAVMRKTQWPLVLFNSLIFSTIVQPPKGEKTEIIRDSNLDDTNIKGIPLTAIDQYTRVGKAVIRGLQSKVPDLKLFSTRQIGTGIFYSEGDSLDKRLSSPKLDSIHQHAGIADFEGAYGDAPSYFALREILVEHNDLLQSLRKRHLKDYFKAQSDELQFGEGE